MIPQRESTPRVLPPVGTHMARVVEIIYLGTQMTNYKNEDGSDKKQFKIRIKWELPSATHVFKEGDPAKPFVVSKEVTHSMDKKSTLRPIVEAVIGTSLTDEEAWKFNTDQIIGLPCLVNIVHEEYQGDKFAKVKAVTEIMRGQSCPPQVNPSYIFSVVEFKQAEYDKLPDFIKEKIARSDEYKKLKGISSSNNDGEIPF